MRNINAYIVCLAAILTLVSCKKSETVGVLDLDNVDQSLFQITSAHVRNMDNGIPDDCYMPGGGKVSEYQDPEETKTTSVSAVSVIESLFSCNAHKKVLEIVGLYKSVDGDGNPITLSGKVLVPLQAESSRYVLVSHYTIGSNPEAPSNCFPLEGVLAKRGFVMIFPDYEGYGYTSDHVHPYLMREQTAQNVVDMYIAVEKLLRNSKYAPNESEINLMGYSQGGATTMAVQYLLETKYPEVEIHRVFAGGGPYDIRATYSDYVMNNWVSYPCSVPLVVQGMVLGAHLNLDMKDMMQPYVYENLDNWINSKRFPTGSINTFINTHYADQILTAVGMDQNSQQVIELYKAMTENSVLALSWSPKAPVFMMHSIDDNTVQFLNASLAKSKWKDSNIQYNFGHYGTHESCCLRFIFTVAEIID